MANFNEYFPTLLLWEGGYGNDPNDKGGATKYGVILSEWISKGYDKDGDGDIDIEDLKKITQEDAAKIAKTYYWDKIKADDINSQSVAEFIVDWAYNAGIITVIKIVQTLIGTTSDGIVGKNTLKIINTSDSKALFNLLKSRRIAFYNNIVKTHPSQNKFLKGWLNRTNSFTFKS